LAGFAGTAFSTGSRVCAGIVWGVPKTSTNTALSKTIGDPGRGCFTVEEGGSSRMRVSDKKKTRILKKGGDSASKVSPYMI